MRPRLPGQSIPPESGYFAIRNAAGPALAAGGKKRSSSAASPGIGRGVVLPCKTSRQRIVPSCRAHDDGISSAAMTDRSTIQDAIHAGGGLLRLEPCWVPRSFMHPGRRLRLHPDDLYAYGAQRGGINERWFSSTTNADNGPGTPPDEGLSYVRRADGSRFLLKAAVEAAGDLLLG